MTAGRSSRRSMSFRIATRSPAAKRRAKPKRRPKRAARSTRPPRRASGTPISTGASSTCSRQARRRRARDGRRGTHARLSGRYRFQTRRRRRLPLSSPDGSTVIFAARASGSSQGLGDPSSLYSRPHRTGARRRDRLDPEIINFDRRACLSPNGLGARLSLRQTVRRSQRRARALMIRDMNSGAVRRSRRASITRRRLLHGPRTAQRSTPLPKTSGRRGYSPSIRRAAPRTPLTGDGHVSGLDVAKGVADLQSRCIGFTIAGFRTWRGQWRTRQLTHVGEDALAQTPMSTFEQFSFTGWNGETVHGYVVKPTGFEEGHKYPVAFLIHGGPYGSFGNAWSYRWNPQVWVGHGLRSGDDRFSRLQRLWRGLREIHHRPLGRPTAGRSAEGLGRRAGEIFLPRRRPCLRARRLLWRLHDRLDRRKLGEAVEMPGRS